MNEILAEMMSYGLNPGELALNGKIHRFAADDRDSKKSGWYVGFSNHTRKSGELFYVVVYGNYKTGDDYKFVSDGVKLSPEDRKALKEQMAKAKKISEAVRAQVQLEVSEAVESKWETFSSEGVSEYLIRKRISECKDLGIKFAIEKQGEQRGFYVPMRDITGKIWSVQRIQNDGGKFFFEGGRVSGCFHTLGQLESGDLLYVTEGLATAASIRLATGKTVIVAFNSGNLVRVCEELRKKYKDKTIVVCGDDDRWAAKADGTPYNAGREKGTEAANLSMGTVVFPRFQNIESKPTDFNDLHLLEGLDAVSAQLKIPEAPKVFLSALGFKEKEYFFTSSDNRQIVAVSKFSTADFLNLLPMEYWEAVYPGAGAQRVDWNIATSSLMSQARARGIFQSRNVRGAGVWNDEGRIVVNMGDHLLVDGKVVQLNGIKSKFFYTLGVTLPGLHSNALTHDECNTLIDACSQFKWIKKDYSFLLCGALVTSRICGALPIRPHVWLTGSAQNGKSTLFERLIKPILGEPVLKPIGNTSEAGIRQSIKADAIPVIFDEFETNNQRSSEKIEECIELMRASWSDSDSYIIKGGSSGNATAFQVKFAAIVSSIRTNLKNDADRSRFAIIELAPHGSDQEHWAKLSSLLDSIDVEYGNRLFARTVTMIPVLLSNYRMLKKKLATRVSQRFGDQYGMLLAGYSILLQDEPLSEAEAEFLADHVLLSDEREEAKVADHDECWNYLLTKKIKIVDNTDTYELSIGDAIGRSTSPFIHDALQIIGIKVSSNGVSVASRHSELENHVFKGTRWSNNWGSALSRIPSADKNKPVWLAGKTQKCVFIPMDKAVEKET